jgi:hypothetical protein
VAPASREAKNAIIKNWSKIFSLKILQYGYHSKALDAGHLKMIFFKSLKPEIVHMANLMLTSIFCLPSSNPPKLTNYRPIKNRSITKIVVAKLPVNEI